MPNSPHSAEVPLASAVTFGETLNERLRVLTAEVTAMRDRLECAIVPLVGAAAEKDTNAGVSSVALTTHDYVSALEKEISRVRQLIGRIEG
jgi:hypothetical protein